MGKLALTEEITPYATVLTPHPLHHPAPLHPLFTHRPSTAAPESHTHAANKSPSTTHHTRTSDAHRRPSPSTSRPHPHPEPPPHPLQIEQQGSRRPDPPRSFQIQHAEAVDLIHKTWFLSSSSSCYCCRRTHQTHHGFIPFKFEQIHGAQRGLNSLPTTGAAPTLVYRTRTPDLFAKLKEEKSPAHFMVHFINTTTKPALKQRLTFVLAISNVEVETAESYLRTLEKAGIVIDMQIDVVRKVMQKEPWQPVAVPTSRRSPVQCLCFHKSLQVCLVS